LTEGRQKRYRFFRLFFFVPRLNFVSYPVALELPLEPLLEKLCSLDRELGDALRRYRGALIARVPPPGCLLETYPFGQSMFLEGRPTSGRLSQELLSPQSATLSFPFGIILKGYAEITDYVFGAGAPRLAPHAILKPGNFIGIFELLDWITDGQARGVPDWTITAGAASICCAVNTSNDAFARHLRRRFGLEINEHAIKTSDCFLEQLLDVPSIKNEFSEWTTDVLYFGIDWFKPLLDDDVDDRTRSAGRELVRILSERAWRAASKIRPSASSIAPFFFGGRANGGAKFTRPELHERQRALHIFTSLYDLYSGRRPMFVPERQDGPWGPMGKICATVLKGYNNDEFPFVLRPEYITDARPSAVAYVPVENIASDLVESGGAHERALMNALNVIDAATRLDEQTEGRSILSEFGNLIKTLSIRMPAGKENGGTRGASVIIRDVLRNPGKGVKFVPMEEGGFFEPYDVKLEKPGAEFFKTCIRFAIPS
jgi:hypothetical protein